MSKRKYQLTKTEEQALVNALNRLKRVMLGIQQNHEGAYMFVEGTTISVVIPITSDEVDEAERATSSIARYNDYTSNDYTYEIPIFETVTGFRCDCGGW